MKTIIAIASIALTSCGGTFMLRPDGSLAYTTTELIKPAIIVPEK